VAAEDRSAAQGQDNDALWLAYEFEAFRERVRSELDGLVKWANENADSSHSFISIAWAKQVSMWAMSHAARLDEYEEKLNA
jgi:hypothetical protein